MQGLGLGFLIDCIARYFSILYNSVVFFGESMWMIA